MCFCVSLQQQMNQNRIVVKKSIYPKFLFVGICCFAVLLFCCFAVLLFCCFAVLLLPAYDKEEVVGEATCRFIY